MSKRKTRVTRMSRRKASTGTRKQKGGWVFDYLLNNLNPRNWFAKKTDPNAPLAPAAAATNTADVSKKPGAAADVPDNTNTGQDDQHGGARKTRHRRRHHRK